MLVSDAQIKESMRQDYQRYSALYTETMDKADNAKDIVVRIPLLVKASEYHGITKAIIAMGILMFGMDSATIFFQED